MNFVFHFANDYYFPNSITSSFSQSNQTCEVSERETTRLPNIHVGSFMKSPYHSFIVALIFYFEANLFYTMFRVLSVHTSTLAINPTHFASDLTLSSLIDETFGIMFVQFTRPSPFMHDMNPYLPSPSSSSFTKSVNKNIEFRNMMNTLHDFTNPHLTPSSLKNLACIE